MGLNIDVLGGKEFLRAFDGQRFDHVHVFAPAIPAPTGVAFRILVGQAGSLSLHYSPACKVFAGDQFDVLKLAPTLVADGLCDLWVDGFEGQCRVFFLNERFCCHVVFLYEVQKGGKGLLERVPAALVRLAPQADRIGHVRCARLELAQQIRLLASVWKEKFDHALVIARHDEDMRCLSHEIFGDRLAAEVCQIDAVHR